MPIAKLQAAIAAGTRSQVHIGRHLGLPRKARTDAQIIQANVALLSTKDFELTSEKVLDGAEQAAKHVRETEPHYHQDLIIWTHWITYHEPTGTITGYGYDGLKTLENLRMRQPAKTKDIKIVWLQKSSNNPYKTYICLYPNEEYSNYQFPKNLNNAFAEYDRIRLQQAKS